MLKLGSAAWQVGSCWSFNGLEPGGLELTIRNKERERERGREVERKKDTGTKALMEQRCFIQHGVGMFTILQGSYSQQR